VGTWGEGPFDDDNAADWVWELQEAADWRVIESALRGAADVPSSDYLEAPDGQIAWAAAAVVAAADDPSAVPLPDEASQWLAAHRDSRPTELRPLAVRALQRVMGSESELAELWQEAGDDGWRANIQRLSALVA
jgi:hypothetical protein